MPGNSLERVGGGRAYVAQEVIVMSPFSRTDTKLDQLVDDLLITKILIKRFHSTKKRGTVVDVVP